jgi:hypothetical protein
MPRRAAMAKYWVSDMQCKVIDECLQLFGGYGYMMEYPIARCTRRARAAHLRRHQRDHEGAAMPTSTTTCAPRVARARRTAGLHQASPVWLLRTLLQALQARNRLDTALVDDVVLGCVTPVGEQGADIARTAVLDAEWAQTVAGVTQSRFCASGLESVNLAAAKVASGYEDLVVAGGVESMSRWPMGSDGGAWVMDPRINQKTGFVPQGVGADLIATSKAGTAPTSTPSRCARTSARPRRAPRGASPAPWCRCTTLPACLLLAEDETIRASASAGGMAKLEPSLRHDGRDGLRCHRAAQVHHRRAHRPRAPRRQLAASSTARR